MSTFNPEDFIPLEERRQQESLNNLGEDIRAWREIRGITRSRLSSETGISTSTLARLENGDPGVSISHLIRVVRHLRIPHFLDAASPFESEEGQRLMSVALKQKRKV